MIVVAVLILCSCSAGPILTSDNFDRVAIGASMAQIKDMYGTPFDVKSLPNGSEEYRYIQRIYVHQNVTDQIEYVFIVRNGRVIDKRCREVGSMAGLQVQ